MVILYLLASLLGAVTTVAVLSPQGWPLALLWRPVRGQRSHLDRRRRCLRRENRQSVLVARRRQRPPVNTASPPAGSLPPYDREAAGGQRLSEIGTAVSMSNPLVSSADEACRALREVATPLANAWAPSMRRLRTTRWSGCVSCLNGSISTSSARSHAGPGGRRG
jgi:hypothetical protein